MNLDEDSGGLGLKESPVSASIPVSAAQPLAGADFSDLFEKKNFKQALLAELLRSEHPVAAEISRHLKSIQANFKADFGFDEKILTGNLKEEFKSANPETVILLVNTLNIDEQLRQRILADLQSGQSRSDDALEDLAREVSRAICSGDTSLIGIAEVLSADGTFQSKHPALVSKLLASLRAITTALAKVKPESKTVPGAAVTDVEIITSEIAAPPSSPQQLQNNLLTPLIEEAVIATAVVIALANMEAAEQQKAKNLIEKAKIEAERQQQAAEQRIRNAIEAFESRTGCDVPENFDVAYRTDPPAEAELRAALSKC